jgi:tripartite-type tricarboxylate transporter receptor subunit TctC
MKHLARLAAALAVALKPSMARAQDAWPSRSITFIVPYAAGGYTDLVGRMTARYVERALGKTVIIDDRPGAGGIVGTQAVANSAPDGYTFCVCSVGAISIAGSSDSSSAEGLSDLRLMLSISSM